MAKTILMSFLGKVSPDENGTYKRVSYDIDGEISKPCSLFALALEAHLRPDKTVIFGTPTSGWDMLIDDALLERVSGDESEIYAELGLIQEKAKARPLAQEDLDELTKLLSDAFKVEFLLRIIPNGFDEREQLQLLKIMADEVEYKDRVHVDVTHGFRHLPMVALTSALHLRSVMDASINGLWYAAFQGAHVPAKAVKLNGLLAIADSVRALSMFDKDGDYTSLSKLFENNEPAGSNLSQLLKTAAFYENTLNFKEAKVQIQKLNSAISKHRKNLSTELQLIIPEIERRISWAESTEIVDRMAKVVRRSLNNGDYLRAALVLFEAIITSACEERGLDASSYDSRKMVQLELEEHLSETRSPAFPYYLELRSIRNSLAHGNEAPSSNVARILGNSASLSRSLTETLKLFVACELKIHPGA